MKSKDNQILRAEITMIRQKIVDLVDKQPQKAAIILALWVNSSGRSRKLDKKVG